jgi:hypothetical protein
MPLLAVTIQQATRVYEERVRVVEVRVSEHPA